MYATQLQADYATPQEVLHLSLRCRAQPAIIRILQPSSTAPPMRLAPARGRAVMTGVSTSENSISA